MGNASSPLPDRRTALRRLVAIAAATVTAVSVLLDAAESRPKLVVLIVVDQMRADYVERFLPNWSSGFRRLVNGGAWFTEAAYPYMSTLTCVGHATIATGALPREHGVFHNTWYDPSRDAVVACTHDPTVQTVRYAKSPPREQHGPGALTLPTLGDQMRESGGRVVSLALKARSAIMLAGHGGSAVTWLSEGLDSWETSSAYSTQPVSQVAAFVAANPIAADFGKVWTLMLEPGVYTGTDNDPAEAPPKGWGPAFPHALRGTDDEAGPGHAYDYQWERSPYADAYVARMATALASELRLDRGPAPNLLAVSFSSPDLVGHLFGPRSHELQDMYFHLDQTLGVLLARLDTLVGRDNYTVALTSDHGVGDIPEQLARDGGEGGRLVARRVQEIVQEAAASVLGPGIHAARVNSNDVYLKPGVYERLAADPAAMHTVRSAIENVQGVARVFTRDELAAGSTSEDALLRAAALSYVAGRSGDMVVATRPGWLFTVEAASHGSARSEDQRVPIVLFGHGVKPGRYTQAVTPADIAPTLAAIAGVRLTHATGRALREALQ